MDKLIVNFTPTGMIPTKEQTTHVPITPEEIINDVKEACAIGISMVHLHARDDNQEPHYSKKIYKKIISGIRDAYPDLVVCVSTSGRAFFEFEKRSEVLFLDDDNKPDMASLTLSSLNFNKTASMNEPEMIQKLAATMKQQGIRAELEAFDLGMINYSKYLIKKGLLTPPYYFNLILGNIACAQANLLSAGLMINELPENAIVAFGGIGSEQLKINSMSISMGYGVRVGIEDNIWFDSSRETPATNAMLLERIHTIAQANGRGILSPQELRKCLKLQGGNGNYGMAMHED